MFSCEFYQIFQEASFTKQLWVTASVDTLSYSLRRPQPQKMFPLTLVILNIFGTKAVNRLKLFVEILVRDPAVTC